MKLGVINSYQPFVVTLIQMALTQFVQLGLFDFRFDVVCLFLNVISFFINSQARTIQGSDLSYYHILS